MVNLLVTAGVCNP